MRIPENTQVAMSPPTTTPNSITTRSRCQFICNKATEHTFTHTLYIAENALRSPDKQHILV